MVVLALDTTTPTGSVALARDGTLLAHHRGDAATTHGERLPGEVVDILAACGLALVDVDVYAVCSGPGSFTGLRVGLATIQAFALAHGRPVVAVPALEALSWAALATSGTRGRGPDLVAALMDAHRGEAFGALYVSPDVEPPVDETTRTCAYPELIARVSPAVGVPDAVIDDWGSAAAGHTLEVIGDAVAAVRPVLEARFGDRAHLTPEMPALGPLLARIGAARARTGGVAPHAVRPVYIRQPDAELARERRSRRPEGHAAE